MPLLKSRENTKPPAMSGATSLNRSWALMTDPSTNPIAGTRLGLVLNPELPLACPGTRPTIPNGQLFLQMVSASSGFPKPEKRNGKGQDAASARAETLWKNQKHTRSGLVRFFERGAPSKLGQIGLLNWPFEFRFSDQTFEPGLSRMVEPSIAASTTKEDFASVAKSRPAFTNSSIRASV